MSVVGVALEVVFEVFVVDKEEEVDEAFALSVFWPSKELRGESLEDNVGSAIVVVNKEFLCAGPSSDKIND